MLNGLTTLAPTVAALILYLGSETHLCWVAYRPWQHSAVPAREQVLVFPRNAKRKSRQRLERMLLHTGTLWKLSWEQIRGHMAKLTPSSKEITGPLQCFLQQSLKSCILDAGVRVEKRHVLLQICHHSTVALPPPGTLFYCSKSEGFNTYAEGVN